MKPVLFLATSLVFAIKGDAVPFPKSTGKVITELLDRRFTDRKGGMVIGIIDRTGQQVFSAGKLANGSARSPDANSLFEIGSITKTFTSLLALEMDRRGELKLSDPITRHLPKGIATPSFKGNPITILNLAVQDSGLPFNPDNFSAEKFPESYNGYTADLLYEFLGDYQLTNAPGSRFQYSNTGMSVLGHIMERITGKTFGDLVRERIALPLGMNDTQARLSTQLQSRMAQGHDPDGKPQPNMDLQVFGGAGNLKSTVNDMLKYAAAQLGLRRSKLYPSMKRSHRQFHSGDRTFGNTCMPWVDQRLYQPTDSRLIGHAGGTGGFTSFIGFDLKKQRAIVVLSSDRSVGASPIGWTVLQDMPLTDHNLRFLVREITGVGVALAIDQETELLKITRTFKHSSAGQAGLRSGQLIRSINRTPTKGLPMSECLKLLGGKEGAKISLEIIVPGEKTANPVTVTREKFLTSD